MNRRDYLSHVLLAGLGLAGSRVLGEEPISLLNTLQKGLYCRRELEFDFVELVALKVEQKELPLPVVLSMFKWARERRPRQPFPYFQAGIRERAKALNVEL